MARLLRATEMAHALVRERVVDGELVVDATVGNGHDTVFLAELVGAAGRVVGFDVQEQALAATRARVGAAGFAERIELHRENHAVMGGVVEGGAAAVMFNLGYFPGGDHGVVTRPDTTVAALAAAAGLLRAGGIVTCVVYPGHEGGVEESAAVGGWFGDLQQGEFAVVRYEFTNQRNSPPFMYAAERRG